jgi:uncharacterized protein (DUF2147 family)
MTPLRAVLLFLALQLTTAAATPPPPADMILGIWRNPSGSIDVRTQPCGPDLCGVIVRASPQAAADAKDAGVGRLIGTQLLENYQKIAPNKWAGTVYVPDMDRRFSSRIEALTPTTLKISGCLMGEWLCKAQIWTRA